MRTFSICLWVLLSITIGASVNADEMEWVTISGGNSSCDTRPQGCFGKVDYTYRVGKYEVTNTQYVDFLNAVADTDGHALYDPNMGISNGGISRTGSAGGYVYAARDGYGNNPVNYVSFYNTLRFANWLHNGKPVGEQGTSTTEDGAYTLTSTAMNQNQVTRNSGASYFLTSEDEWYKAAFYDDSISDFFDYATQTDSAVFCAMPGGASNSANCSETLGMPSAVGAYLNSISPNGTFDQNGNLSEWTESRYGSLSRILRGGSFLTGSPLALSASSRATSNSMFPGQEFVGFRVASIVPEPSTGLLMGMGLLGLAKWRRRSRRTQYA